MKGQTKKGLRLAAYGVIVALILTMLPVSALAANCNAGTYSNNCPQGTYDIIRMFGQQGCDTASQKSGAGANCTPSDILNALKNSGASSQKSGAGANCSPSDILNALKNGKSIDVNSLYRSLCPSSSPSCPAKPASPTPVPTSAPTPTANPSTPAPTAPPATSSPDNAASALEKQMVDLINAERAKAGASPLVIDAKVTQVARAKSQDMIDRGYFSHTSPTYGSPFQMLSTFGVSYRTAGENIAMNRSMQSAHTALMNSEGHRKNILNTSYKSIGVGIVANASGYLYITQMFIG